MTVLELGKKDITVKQQDDKLHGIFTMDPGTTTGVGYTEHGVKGYMKPKFAFEGAGWTTQEVICKDELGGAAEIASLWLWLVDHWTKLGIHPSRMYFVYEDFILRPGPHSSARTGLSPVRVTAHVQGILIASKVHYFPQQPGDAKSRWTNERLRRVGLYSTGSEHRRDATRHALLFYIRNLVDQTYRR